mmetsp:Transcript_28833/g.90912  ORF Transcript_28833/g.90912 Transcript_28833/m.90912 type:complete len:250 (+) Transcript_28833:71-820(+)
MQQERIITLLQCIRFVLQIGSTHAHIGLPVQQVLQRAARKVCTAERLLCHDTAIQDNVLQAEVPQEKPHYLVGKGATETSGCQPPRLGLDSGEAETHIYGLRAMAEGPLIGHVSHYVGNLRPQLHRLYSNSVPQELDGNGVGMSPIAILQRALVKARGPQDLFVVRSRDTSGRTQSDAHKLCCLQLALIDAGQFRYPFEDVAALANIAIHEGVQAVVLHQHLILRPLVLRNMRERSRALGTGNSSQPQV